MKKSLFTVVLSTLVISLFAQSNGAEDISFYADAMINAEQAKNRTTAAKKFETLIVDLLAEADSYNNTLEDLPFIFVRYPDDQSFRTITWQIDKGEGVYEYDGFVQLPDNSSFPMAGKRGREALKQTGAIQWKQWRGGLVYKILTVGTGSKMSHYLLTYRQLDQFTKAKTVEHIAVSPTGVTLAGEKLFADADGESYSNRLTLQYSSDSNCSIKYQEESQQLVYDNLIGAMGRIKGQGPTSVPDGSYKAYILQSDGRWNYMDKLFDEKFTSPPRGGISTGDRDILGRRKN